MAKLRNQFQVKALPVEKQGTYFVPIQKQRKGPCFIKLNGFQRDGFFQADVLVGTTKQTMLIVQLSDKFFAINREDYQMEPGTLLHAVFAPR